MKQFVIGDIHGHLKALKQCIERSGIDKENDTLIVLGDVTDRGPDSMGVIDELMTFKHLIGIRGNHDLWFEGYLQNHTAEPLWLQQGGIATLESLKNYEGTEEHIKSYFDKLVNYCIDEDNNLFVHAGFDVNTPLEHTDIDTLLWDRDFFITLITDYYFNIDTDYDDYNKIFIGHTPTQNAAYFHPGIDLEPFDPIIYNNVIALDTGIAYDGRISIMNIDTLDYWQSDFKKELYKEEKN